MYECFNTSVISSTLGSIHFATKAPSLGYAGVMVVNFLFYRLSYLLPKCRHGRHSNEEKIQALYIEGCHLSFLTLDWYHSDKKEDTVLFLLYSLQISLPSEVPYVLSKRFRSITRSFVTSVHDDTRNKGHVHVSYCSHNTIDPPPQLKFRLLARISSLDDKRALPAFVNYLPLLSRRRERRFSLVIKD
ncbi:hypothetical protein QVD17_20162 [Tagetes erecta]|uniref:Uncharacterized protein n=1 Tax=Tagetes erecta TaxID=13708 RepID=A0AAD8KL96_TARER|nr:hypothetical protein QVD17_20162 [Tagetes erecta]